MTLEWVGWDVVALRGWGSDHTGIMYAVGVVCILVGTDSAGQLWCWQAISLCS